MGKPETRPARLYSYRRVALWHTLGTRPSFTRGLRVDVLGRSWRGGVVSGDQRCLLTLDGITTLFCTQWNVEPYANWLKQNASLEKSPTQIVVKQTNHFFAAQRAYIIPEMLKSTTKLNHLSGLKTKLYVQALQVAFSALRALQPVQLAVQGELVRKRGVKVKMRRAQ
jgi:hypothetical protein